MPASTTAQGYIRAADRAGERTAKSTLDLAVQDFEVPETPEALTREMGGRQQRLATGLDLGGAKQRMERAGADVISQGGIIESRIKQEEVAKTPIGDLDSEIDRLTSMSFRILPSMLARTDIEDFNAKIRLANKVQGHLQGEINRVVKTRNNIKSDAEGRAQIRIDTMKSEADLIDKRRAAAKEEFDSKLELYKAGTDNLEDLVGLALDLRELNDKKMKAAGDGNPFFGLGGGDWSDEEITAFGVYEATGNLPVEASVNKQYELSFNNTYRKWVEAGRPGSSRVVKIKNPSYEAMQGTPFGLLEPEYKTERKDIKDIWADVARIQLLKVPGGTSTTPKPKTGKGEYDLDV